MSWGERSCSKSNAPLDEYGGCRAATMGTCNVNCQYYTPNGQKPDSVRIQKLPLTKNQLKALRRKLK